MEHARWEGFMGNIYLSNRTLGFLRGHVVVMNSSLFICQWFEGFDHFVKASKKHPESHFNIQLNVPV